MAFTVSQATVLTYTVDASNSTYNYFNVSCNVNDTVNINVVNALPVEKFFCPFGMSFTQAPTFGNYTFTFVVTSSDIGLNWSVYEVNNTSIPIGSGMIMQSMSTGIYELSKVKVDIYPNPTSDYINVKLDEPVKNINLYDLSGKLVLSTVDNKINVSELNKGTYMLMVNTGTSTVSRKVILN